MTHTGAVQKNIGRDVLSAIPSEKDILRILCLHPNELDGLSEIIKRSFEKIKYKKVKIETTDVITDANIITLPLFGQNESDIGESISWGLSKVYELRKTNPVFSTVFIVRSQCEIPQYHHPNRKMFPWARRILDPVRFSQDNVTLLGEARLDTENETEYINFIVYPDVDFEAKLTECIQKLYDNFGKDTANIVKKYYEFFPDIDDKKDNGSHTSHDNNLRTYPFFLWEFIKIKRKIESWTKKDNRKIRLFLIDDKLEKFKEEDGGEGSLFKAFFEFSIENLFEVTMMGNEIMKTNNEGEPKPDFIKSNNDHQLKNEFCFKSFLTDDEYANKVNRRIKKSDFILLDFVLDNVDNTYFGFHFIKDIYRRKSLNPDPSPDWYFITSSADDIVLRYSQSGVLSEFYKYAVVNIGANPGKKSQIIFIYKLLRFIYTRIHIFVTYHKFIKNFFVTQKTPSNLSGCPLGFSISKEIQNSPLEKHCFENKSLKDKCLNAVLRYIELYLLEFDAVAPIIFNDSQKRDKYKKIAKLLKDTIDKFYLLPRADWPIIQHQIDYINSSLKEEGGFFHCHYINKEIADRSEVF